jgi:3-hydroxyacyl-CoA dehydrogenase/3a,7a,12a-trihydroxy-5b-cholest-24-enoyl-CoA hydratase
MTETVFPKEVVDKIKPEFVAAFTTILCHDTCPDTGALYEVGAGFYSKLRFQRTQGLLLPTSKVTPESIRDGWDKVANFDSGATFP